MTGGMNFRFGFSWNCDRPGAQEWNDWCCTGLLLGKRCMTGPASPGLLGIGSIHRDELTRYARPHGQMMPGGTPIGILRYVTLTAISRRQRRFEWGECCRRPSLRSDPLRPVTAQKGLDVVFVVRRYALSRPHRVERGNVGRSASRDGQDAQATDYEATTNTPMMSIPHSVHSREAVRSKPWARTKI